ncbi:hypothetical cytosolic protein [Syntrophus aciditrophicus SB]|uniref:Hypothetical cytosolic protein n=1 Tax=Syntrophus aciditrophicus (strain SB) TaxID=56780 RepID=Q2LR68_SYNAS|nr:hypothetical cytosolic protein [Syntrophus aciditrophicus SB]
MFLRHKVFLLFLFLSKLIKDFSKDPHNRPFIIEFPGFLSGKLYQCFQKDAF